MNTLLDQFPTAVEIDNVEYEINSDFRTCLKIILAFEDLELTIIEKQAIMLDLLYKQLPPDKLKAIDIAIKFLNCGDTGTNQSFNNERLYSFQKDARYIYSAIKQTHGVDLETVGYLHWWKFCYMFLDLNEDCFFIRIIGYRQKRNQNKLTQEERKYCNSIKDILDLQPDVSTDDQAVLDKFYAQLK